MKLEADFERFNLRHLRYFLAVCESGSFRAASATLHIAQSAVSRRVADLERAFGVTLFERRPRGVALTEAGIALRDSAISIGCEIEAAHATLDRYGRGEEGTITVGFFGTTARLSFVPELIARFRVACPHIRLELQPLPHSVPDEAALSPLDAAFLENRPEKGNRTAMLVHHGAHMLALPLGHPLGALSAVPFASLSQQELIITPELTNRAFHDRLIRAAARRGQALNIVHEAESECSRLAFAAAGIGIALVSPLAINHRQSFEVDYRPIADVTLPFELYLSIKPGESVVTGPFTEITRALLDELPSLPL